MISGASLLSDRAMVEITGWDAEISAFLAPFDGRWPTQDESSPQASSILGRGRPGAGPVVRRARWDTAGRTLEVGIAPLDAPLGSCATAFVYLPSSLRAPPLLFARDGVSMEVSKALDALSSRAASKRTPLSVLIDQVVDAMESGRTWEGGGSSSSLWEGVICGRGCRGFTDLVEIARKHGESLDLLVCLAAAACRSLRRVSLLDPFPHCFLDAGGGRDFDVCTQCVTALPPVCDLEGMICGDREGLSWQQGSLLRWLWDLKGVMIIGGRDAAPVTEHSAPGDFTVQVSLCHDCFSFLYNISTCCLQATVLLTDALRTAAAWGRTTLRRC